jgi:uncharacterized repeat protein (TIGR01451 family)
MAEWFCQIRIDSATAARAMDACDSMNNQRYMNTATVSGTTTSSTSGICTQSVTVAGTSPCSAELLLPPPCALTVSKEVKCKTDPDSAFGSTAQVLPGTTQTYRLRLINSGTVNLPQVCIADALSCSQWLVPNSVTADLAGTNVNACLASAFAASLGTGSRTCYSFGSCRPAAPWIAPGETLTISFDVAVPAGFSQVGAMTDCANSAVVQAYTENCTATPPVSDSLCTGTGLAEFNVLVPGIDCDHVFCVDLDNNGTCEQPFSSELMLPSTTTFPLTINYRSTVSNIGEAPLINVRICDPTLVERALASGLVFGACALCDGACDDGPGDECAETAPLGPGASATANCSIRVPTREAWDMFAVTDPDGNPICYRDDIGAVGTVNTTSLCATGANTTLTSPTCSVNLCIPPPIPMGGCCLPNGDCEEVSEVNCAAIGGIYNGDGTLCRGDQNNNGIDDFCEEPIPTVTTWGLIIMALLLLAAGKVRFGVRESCAR